MWKEQGIKNLSYIFTLECFSYLEEAYDQKENRYAMRGARIIGIALGLSFYFLNIWFAIDYSVSKPDLLYALEFAFLLIGLLTLISLGIGTGILAIRSWAHSHGFINRPFQVLYALLIAFVFEYLLLIPTILIYSIAFRAVTSRITHGIGNYLDKFDYASLLGGIGIMEKSNYMVLLVTLAIWGLFYFLNYTFPAIVAMDFKGNDHLRQRYQRRDEFDIFVLRSDMMASSYGADFYSNKFLINRVKEIAADNFVNEKANPKTLYDYTEQEALSDGPKPLVMKPAPDTAKKSPPIDPSNPKDESSHAPWGAKGGRHNRY